MKRKLKLRDLEPEVAEWIKNDEMQTRVGLWIIVFYDLNRAFISFRNHGECIAVIESKTRNEILCQMKRRAIEWIMNINDEFYISDKKPIFEGGIKLENGNTLYPPIT